jgi:hypothetical protein
MRLSPGDSEPGPPVAVKFGVGGKREVWKMSKYLITAAAGALLLAFSAVNASAAYVCNGNVCWVVKEKYDYPGDAKIVVREETWKPGPEITIREPGTGRGYYVGPTWRTW